MLNVGLADVHMEEYAYTLFKLLGTVQVVEDRLGMIEICATNLPNWNKHNFQHFRHDIDESQKKA